VTPTYIALDIFDLALAALLILLNGALSVWLRLGLARQFLIAAARMCVQLGLMG
jgi:putative ABC transport system permease protein